MTDDTMLVVSQEQVACDLQGEIAILNLKNSTYYGLNPVGARVWELLQTPITLADLRRNLLAEYDAEPERIGADLTALLADLERHQLIQVHHEANS